MRNPIRMVRYGLAALVLSLAGAPAMAATPQAGATIGNQAIATYENAVGQTIEVTSNLVETTVNQVRSVVVAPDQTKNVAIGGKVFFPHTITNTGNGPDTFDLTTVENDIAGDPFDIVPANILIYPDADLDGVPDNLTPITATPSILAGGVFGVVIEVTIPSNGVDAGDSESITLTATGQGGGTPPSDAATDTILVTGEPIIDLTKSMTPSSVAPGDAVTVTLTYQNNGLAEASDVVITDTLPAGLTYNTLVAAVWSDAPTTNLTDADDGDVQNGVGHNLAYDFNVTTAGEVTIAIDRVPAGRRATITFQATVDAGVSGTLINTADFTVTNGPDGSSNPATITVTDQLAVTIADVSATAAGNDDLADSDLDPGVGATVSDTDTDATRDDVVSDDGSVNGTFDSDNDNTNDSYPQGGTVSFEFVLTNHSNVPQVFNLTATNGGTAPLNTGTTFPAGTQFSFTDAAGVPLTDSDGDGNPDISMAVAAGGGEEISVITLRAELPDNTSAVRTAVDPAWQATVTATASDDTNVTNQSIASLTAPVIGAVVDIENDNGAADGTDVDNNGDPWRTANVDPGETATFTIVVENNGPDASSYNLQFSGSNFNAGAGLPSGWTVRFLDAGNAEVSNTGLIPSQQSRTFSAEISVPAGTAASSQDIYFRAISPTNGSSDVKLDRVVVDAVVDVQITPNRTAQAAEGGVVVLSHTIRNNSNITIEEGDITLSGFTTFSGTLFLDDGTTPGVLDAGDSVITNFSDITGGLAAGASVTVFHRVQVPANATAGQQEAATITLDSTLNANTTSVTDSNTANNVVTDTITVVSGDLTVEKFQVIDANCDDNGGAGFVPGAFTAASLNADPGACIRYRITAENTGTAVASNVTISDQTPSFTTLEECSTDCEVAATVTNTNTPVADAGNPTDGNAGTLTFNFGDLQPGDRAVLEFTVEIDS